MVVTSLCVLDVASGALSVVVVVGDVERVVVDVLGEGVMAPPGVLGVDIGFTRHVSLVMFVSCVMGTQTDAGKQTAR